ncbi:transcription termination factor Rho [Streptosporangiaceae bacterium NEAU-GS5]|nr:transcription termination factor Rho [Streptosporangiaceae bacterium NEAU-GS5]
MTTATLVPPQAPQISRASQKSRRPVKTVSTVHVSGILDTKNKLRTSGYLPGPKDVVVSPDLVRTYDLRPGDFVAGTANGNRLVEIDGEVRPKRRQFAELTPEHPHERLRLETSPGILATRVIDLIAPVGKGTRGLIVAPPKAGKTMILTAIANAITTNHPDAHLMVLLVDERPEEVTDLRKAIDGEILASTFDRAPADHVALAELAVERAKRLVEEGRDVVMLIDSITRLGRAYNLAASGHDRILTGGLAVSALHPPKRILGAARNVSEGGSLTILATALVDTGSALDNTLFEEFKSTGNMDLRLNRTLSDRRVFPAVDVPASGTRREELMLDPAELALVVKLRRALSNPEAYEPFLAKLRATGSNAEFLLSLKQA